MKRFFSYLLTAAAIVSLSLACSKDNGQTPANTDNGGQDQPGGGDEPAVVETKDYYVSLEGAGTKDGKSEANAFSFKELRELLTLALNNSAPEPEGEDPTPVPPVYEDLDMIDGYTIHFADGTYVLPLSADETEGLVLSLPGAEKVVELTLKGSSNAILSGNKLARVLTVGDQVKLTIDGMAVKDGFSETLSGGGIKVHAETEGGKAALVLRKTVFDNNRVCSGEESGTPKCSGGALWCANGTIEAEECVFEAENYGRNGGAIYTDNEKAVATFKSCTFKCHTFNTGGASNNSKGTQKFENCTFDGCYTEGGTGGALHCNAAGAVMEVNNCVFQNCKVFVNEIAKGTISKSTGIISLQKGDFTVKGSTFKNCEGISGAVILLQSDDAGIFKCMDSQFLDNEGKTRGIIQTNGKSAAFFNNCVFKGNKMTEAAWGLILHGGNPSAACFNNCTVYGNTRDKFSNQSVAFNNDGSIILANTTYIGEDGLASVRSTSANNTSVLVANSIVVNKGATVGDAVVTNFVDAGNMKAPFHAYNSILGGSYTAPSTVFELNASVSDAKEADLAGGSFDGAKGVYTWNGPVEGFTKMTAEGFETAVKSVNVNMGNTIIDGELGTAFYSWLSEIGAIGKDALGTARGAAWWPGAYQAN